MILRGVIVAASMILAFGLTACEDDTPPPPRGASAATSTPRGAPEHRNDPLGAPAGRVRIGVNEPVQATPPSARPRKAPEPPAPQPRRDLATELRGLIGDPTSCLPSDTVGLPPEITFRITATVVESGVVTRSTVSAPGLPAETQECVQRRLSYARFRAPVPNAPQTVTTQVVLQQQPDAGSSGN